MKTVTDYFLLQKHVTDVAVFYK